MGMRWCNSRRPVLNLVLCALLVFGAVSGLAGDVSASELTEIRFLTMAGPAGDEYTEVFRSFEQHGFRVIVEQVPWVTYLEKAALAMQAPQSPYDVINANAEWVLGEFVVNGQVLSLNSFIERDNFPLDDFLPVTLANAYWRPGEDYKATGLEWDWDQAELYGIPSLPDTTPLAYRKDWFAAAGLTPPTTWNEFLEIAPALTVDANGDGRTDRWAYAFASQPEGGQLTDYWMLFAYAWGANLLNENFEPAFNNPKGIEATKFMAALLHQHGVVPRGVLTYGIPEAFDAYKKGITAMTTQWGNALASTEDPNESMAAGVTAYTLPPAMERVGARFAQWAYAIPSNARNPEASWEFIKLASSTEAQIALLPEVPPSRQSVVDYVNETMPDSYVAALAETIASGEVAVKPQIPRILEIDAALALPLYEVVAGETTAEEALQRADRDIRRILKEIGLLE